MLLVMTFNYPILIMLCAGLSAGNVGFSFIKLPKLSKKYKKAGGIKSYQPIADKCCAETIDLRATN